MKIVQVCKKDECLKEPELNVQIGNQTHNFCCINGFQKSLDDFQEHLRTGKGVQNN